MECVTYQYAQQKTYIEKIRLYLGNNMNILNITKQINWLHGASSDTDLK